MSGDSYIEVERIDGWLTRYCAIVTAPDEESGRVTRLAACAFTKNGAIRAARWKWRTHQKELGEARRRRVVARVPLE